MEDLRPERDQPEHVRPFDAPNILAFDVPAGSGFVVNAAKWRDEDMLLTLWISNAANWQVAGAQHVIPNDRNYHQMFAVASDVADRTFGVSAMWRELTPPWNTHEAYTTSGLTPVPGGFDCNVWTGGMTTEYQNTTYQIRFT